MAKGINDKPFRPGSYHDFLSDGPPPDLSIVCFAPTGLLGVGISEATAETVGGIREPGRATHVGQIINMTPERRARLALDGWEVPESWLYEPIVHEALSTVQLSPLAHYLEIGRPLMLARVDTWRNPTCWTFGADWLLNHVGDSYGWLLLTLGHGGGALIGQALARLSRPAAGRAAREHWLNLWDGERVCSTWTGITLQYRQAEVYRVADPDQRPRDAHPLTPREQTPDDQADMVAWWACPNRPPEEYPRATILYNSGVAI